MKPRNHELGTKLKQQSCQRTHLKQFWQNVLGASGYSTGPNTTKATSQNPETLLGISATILEYISSICLTGILIPPFNQIWNICLRYTFITEKENTEMYCITSVIKMTLFALEIEEYL